MPAAVLPSGWTVDRTDREAIVRVRDDLDLQSAPALRNTMTELQSDAPRQVTVDLSECQFLDSVGISVLMSAHLRFTENGTRFVLVAPPPIRRVLAVAGLDEALEISLPDSG